MSDDVSTPKIPKNENTTPLIRSKLTPEQKMQIDNEYIRELQRKMDELNFFEAKKEPETYHKRW